ncbi:Uncharacterized protein SAPIO_CDS1355 [Scedosporium apiospermum]|uniref:Uncharacterized protein n=1 Tax=Pseudallescheria apiosperma TaxID=563466 RepID=A0A084GF51_PSEDA|nr:Uncharacterized protein SAPIO_CDS1355 [Scedosporium apiospermum]KEZ45963.1 Uncharacterized protein SAPIO_CDS1355 [Scedosporium apiospermum]
MNQSYPQQPQYAHYPPAPQTYSPPPQQELGSQASRYQTYNDFNQSQYNQTYSRDGQASAGAGSKRAKLFSLEFVSTKWPRIFMLVVSLQAILCLAFEAYVFGRFQTNLGPYVKDNTKADAQYKTIPTFLTLFIFGFLYELVIVWDALRMKNTIQVIGVCISNLALLIYTAIQVEQILEALDILGDFPGALKAPADEIWDDIRPFLVAIPCIIAATTIAMCFAAWKLYQQFAWDILKHIGADYRMKKRFLHYQIYIALLKFDFFFFLGFMVQFLVVVNDQTDDPEFGLTIAVIPITIFILLLAAWSARRENKWGMLFTIVCYLGALTYFIFKLVRIYQARTQATYRPVRKSLTAFSVITILLILLTIANAIICMRNFGAGLKDHLTSSSRRDEEKPDLNSINLNDLKQPQVPSRMTID